MCGSRVEIMSEKFTGVKDFVYPWNGFILIHFFTPAKH